MRVKFRLEQNLASFIFLFLCEPDLSVPVLGLHSPFFATFCQEMHSPISINSYKMVIIGGQPLSEAEGILDMMNLEWRDWSPRARDRSKGWGKSVLERRFGGCKSTLFS